MTELNVRIADYAVARAGNAMVTIGLGSCVAIILHDARCGIGALAHILLPDPSYARDRSNPARFPSSIVPILVREMKRLGSRGPVVGKLVGGASMFASLMTRASLNVGERNVAAARDALRAAGIPIAAEDVGGCSGRSVRYTVDDGQVLVRTVRGGEHVL